MIVKILYIAAGGALGSTFRFIISYFFKLYFPYFPVGTLFVNIMGSFLIGFFANYLIHKEMSEMIIKFFLIIGFLGSFTTFSAFSIETLELIQDGKILLSILNVLFSFFLCIFVAYIGFSLIKF